jgi:hypothetical protein
VNHHWEQLFKKHIADYQNYMATVGTWELKPTIEERLAAWREEQELEKRAKLAERFLGIKPGP